MERLDSKPGNNQFHGSRACRINRYAICTGEFSVSYAGLAPRHNEIATAVELLHSILIPVRDEFQRSVKTGQVRSLQNRPFWTEVRRVGSPAFVGLADLNRTGDRALVPALLRRAAGTSPMLSRLAVLGLRRRGKVALAGASYLLTPNGREDAKRLVRSHRLWESYLQEFLHLPSDHLHATAERLEHITDDSIGKELAAKTGDPRTDPHGSPIPPRDPSP